MILVELGQCADMEKAMQELGGMRRIWPGWTTDRGQLDAERSLGEAWAWAKRVTSSAASQARRASQPATESGAKSSSAAKAPAVSQQPTVPVKKMPAHAAMAQPVEPAPLPSGYPLSPDGLTCHVCNIAVSTVAHMQAHVMSEWHMRQMTERRAAAATAAPPGLQTKGPAPAPKAREEAPPAGSQVQAKAAKPELEPTASHAAPSTAAPAVSQDQGSVLPPKPEPDATTPPAAAEAKLQPTATVVEAAAAIAPPAPAKAKSAAPEATTSAMAQKRGASLSLPRRRQHAGRQRRFRLTARQAQ